MNRLIAEKNNPQADVYWANEPIRAEVLRQQHIAAPYLSPNADGIPVNFRDPQGFWTGFAARARVLIVHKDENPKPTSVFSYSDPRWARQGGDCKSAFRHDNGPDRSALCSSGR
jgi:iron(III) transport system substrate-binding protein